MLVTGGRFGWARLVSSLGVLGLIGTLACGSRTSTLDPDAYSGSEGQLGNAGKSSPGGGGRPVGTAGTGSTGASSSVDPGVAVAPCQQYCPGYGAQCKKRLKGQECLSTCQGELNNFGARCQALGVRALNCLAPFFSPGGGDCDTAVNRALTQCDTEVSQFEECKKNFSSSLASSPIGACPRSGPTSSANCTQIFECSHGQYVTFCNPSGSSPTALDCSCISPMGETLSSLVSATSADPCRDAAAFCP